MILRTSATALLLLTSAVSASDLPLAGVVATTTAADAQPWSGCYVGVSVGFAAQSVDIPLAAGLYDGGSHVAEGGTLGLRAGCDTQIDRLVLGVVGTVEITRSSGSNAFFPVGPGFPEYLTTEATAYGSLKGRLGYLVDPSLLLYGSAGIAFVHNRHTDYDNGPTFLGEVEGTRLGLTAGIGAEYAFAEGWSAFAEYNYMDFGRADLTLVDGVLWPLPWVNSYDNAAHALTLGVNYRF
ncbi:MAG: outer membrane protein [Devosia sp.]